MPPWTNGFCSCLLTRRLNVFKLEGMWSQNVFLFFLFFFNHPQVYQAEHLKCWRRMHLILLFLDGFSQRI